MRRILFFTAAVIVVAPLVNCNSTVPESPLVGHWQLARDAQDASASANHGRAREVTFNADAGGARFDGRASWIEAPDSRTLALGDEPFSIAMWVNTADSLDDTLGDLLSKYDPKTRRGFNLSIMNYAGVTSSQANYRHVHFGIDNARGEAEWTDHGRLGEAVLIFGMAVCDGELFAGTCEAGQDQAGRVFRFDGKKWTDCGSPDKCNAVCALAVYRGKLYVGTGKYRLAGSSLAESENPNWGGKIFRFDDGAWTHCGTLPDVQAINGLVVFRDRLYAGSLYAPAGFFRYEGGADWVSCGTPEGKRVESLTVYNGHVWATGYDEGAVYRFDGERWEHLGVIEGANQTYGFATHRGELYVSEWPNAKVFRWDGERRWLPSGRLGEEKETMPLMVYNGKMYAGTLPSAEVYRYDEPDWTKVARLDFTPDVRYRRVWSMAVFQGRLFAGTLPSGHVHSIEIGRNVTHDVALPSGWVHIAAVRAADCLRLYVQGKRVATSAKFRAEDYDLTNDQPLRIGFGQHDYFNGAMKDVRLYRGELTDEEVAALAALQQPK